MRTFNAVKGNSQLKARHGTRPAPRHRLICRAEEAGVQDLIARDRKTKDKLPALDAFADGDASAQPSKASQAAQAAAGAQSSSSSTGSSGSGRRGKGKRKGFRGQPVAVTAAQQLSARNARTGSITEGPRTSREAIDAGLQAYSSQQYQEAIELFEMALELPGSGAMRLEGTVKEYSCASEGEENAALYNMACAYVALGQKQSAMTCLEGLLENGFSDVSTLRNDPDLSPLKGIELEALLIKYNNPVAQVLKPKKETELPKMPQWLRPW